MFKIVKEKEDEKKSGNLTEKEIGSKNDYIEDFCNLIICCTSISRNIFQNQNLSENDRAIIDEEKGKIILAIERLADTLELEKDFAEEGITTEKKKLKQKKKPILKEDVIVSNLSEDVISNLKFYNIIERINCILESYSKICVDLGYEKNNAIYLNLIKIENIINEIEGTLACELKNSIKEVK